MENKLLKTSLFGFSKTDVCEYIAKVNADFNEKLKAINAENTVEKNALNEQILTLTAELEKYKQANNDIAQALFDAQQYAAELKLKADNEYKQAENELLMFKETENKKIDHYRVEIEALRKNIVSLLDEIDGKLENQVKKTDNLTAKYNSEEGIPV